MKDIRRTIKHLAEGKSSQGIDLGKSKFALTDYFIESTYIDANGGKFRSLQIDVCRRGIKEEMEWMN